MSKKFFRRYLKTKDIKPTMIESGFRGKKIDTSTYQAEHQRRSLFLYVLMMPSRDVLERRRAKIAHQQPYEI